MARRSQRTKHLIGSVTLNSVVTQEDADAGRQSPVGTKAWNIKSLCGEKYSGTIVYGDRWVGWPNTSSPIYENDMPYNYTGFADSVHTCGACQSKALTRKLKAEPIGYTLADRVDLSAENPPFGLTRWHYKSVYPVVRTADSEIVGFIAIDNGWGKAWEAFGWGSDIRHRDYEAGKLPGPIMERGEQLKYKRIKYRSRDDIAAGVPETLEEYDTSAKGLNSKEAALVLFPTLDAQGQLTTQSECKAKDEASYANWKIRQDERAADMEASRIAADERRAVKQSELGHVEEAFREMLAADSLLTNYQREGVMLAAKHLGIDLNKTPEPVETDQPAPLADHVAQRIADKIGVDTETVQIVHALEPGIKKAAHEAWARHPNNPANKIARTPITDEWGEVVGYE